MDTQVRDYVKELDDALARIRNLSRRLERTIEPTIESVRRAALAEKKTVTSSPGCGSEAEFELRELYPYPDALREAISEVHGLLSDGNAPWWNRGDEQA